MTSHWLFQLVLLAVLLAWVVGAYNRLVRLRAAIISAWEQIVAALVKRSEAMAAVVDAVREPLAAEAATLQALADADAKQRTAADGVRQARARIADVSLWVSAEAGLASRLVLQIHDELLLEVPAGEVEEASRLVVRVMEGAATLRVPIVVDVGSGSSWAAAH